MDLFVVCIGDTQLHTSYNHTVNTQMKLHPSLLESGQETLLDNSCLSALGDRRARAKLEGLPGSSRIPTIKVASGRGTRTEQHPCQAGMGSCHGLEEKLIPRTEHVTSRLSQMSQPIHSQEP